MLNFGVVRDKMGNVMLLANELKSGTVFRYQDEPFRVLDYKHTHLGRGPANVRVKIKGLLTGKVLSVSFGSDEKFEEVDLVKKDLKYLYTDRSNLHLTEEETEKEYEIDRETAGLLEYMLSHNIGLQIAAHDAVCQRQRSLRCAIEGASG